MNTLIRRTVQTVAVSTALFAFSGTASAGDSLTQRVATGVGQVIAAQGNTALVRIREELGQELEQSVRPLLPADFVPEPKEARIAGSAAKAAEFTL